MIELQHIAQKLKSQYTDDVAIPLNFCHLEVWLDESGQVLNLYVYHPDWFWDCFETAQIRYWKELVFNASKFKRIKKVIYCPVGEAIRQITEAGQWDTRDSRCVELQRVNAQKKKVLRICKR